MSSVIVVALFCHRHRHPAICVYVFFFYHHHRHFDLVLKHHIQFESYFSYFDESKRYVFKVQISSQVHTHIRAMSYAFVHVCVCVCDKNEASSMTSTISAYTNMETHFLAKQELCNSVCTQKSSRECAKEIGIALAWALLLLFLFPQIWNHYRFGSHTMLK